MLKVTHPARCLADRSWILSVLLGEFLGLEYSTVIAAGEGVRIEAEGRVLELPDTFFARAEKHWLTPESLPPQPLKRWNTAALALKINLVESEVPVIYGEANAEISANRIRLGLDVFGSAFFMLSRYEEVVKSDRDDLDRFLATASLAYQEGFLDRPMINEYLEILWAALKHLWPGLARRERKSQTLVSCDVDVPYSPGIKSLRRLMRQIGGDLIRRKNLRQAIRTGLNYFYAKTGNYRFDPFLDKFDWMMDQNENVGNRIAFYFVTDQSDETFDGCYSMDEPILRCLIRRIAKRGHEIGLHPSYHTYRDQAQLSREAKILRQVLREEGISQGQIGSRQHFLRWHTPDTARNLEAAGLSYDTTLSFVDSAGFRCGTCYEYPLYDVVDRREINLRERPLVVMDLSVFDYKGCSYGDEGLAIFQRLKQRCYQFDGNFTLLWHNNQFPSRRAMEFYKWVIC